MDAHYHQSRSKMLEEMETDYSELTSEMYGAPGKKLTWLVLICKQLRNKFVKVGLLQEKKKTERLHLVMKVSRIDTNDEILERETFISSI